MDLNIRDFPQDLVTRLKMEALGRNLTLRELVIEKCSQKSVSELSAEVTREMNKGWAEGVVTKRLRSARTASPAGSATTGTEERGMQGDGVDRCSHRMNSVCDDCKKIRSGK